MEVKTVDDLRTSYPALVDQIEKAAAERGATDERRRIQDIEEMAMPGSEALTSKAKFSEPISAADYAKAAMKQIKEQGSAYLAAAAEDVNKSGVNKVENAPPADDHTEGEGKNEVLDAIKAMGQKGGK